jgi:predicted enzyme related to lactoylglutathione lyase
MGSVALQTKATALYPFVPSGPDFRLALAFFAELGFAAAWEHDGYAGMRRGGAYFILQDANVREWQESQMVVIEVESLDAFWSELQPRDLPARFPGAKLKPPTDFPWGREVHIIDPAGVCWHVRQAT